MGKSLKLTRFSLPSLVFLTLLLIIISMAINPTAAEAAGYTVYQITDSSASNANIDVATDASGNPHAVYERNGNIYYKAGIGSEELIGPGTRPAIAVGPDGIPQVVYIGSGGQCYTSKVGGTWQAPTNISGSSSDIDIDVDTSNVAHIAYAACVDGCGYAEIAYSNNAGGNFSPPSIIWDGWYWYESGGRTGRYYDTPRIKIDAAGAYHIITTHHAVDGGMGWTEHAYYIVYKTNAGPGFECGSPYRGNTGASITYNALTVDSTDLVHVLYSQGGTVYYANPGETWSETSLGAFTQPAIASRGTSIGLAYVSGSEIMYSLNSGGGFSIPEIIDTGSSPVVALGSSFIYYLKSDGVNDEIYLQTDAVMESVPSVTQDPSDVTITYGNNAVFTAAANGMPAPSVHWEYSDNSGLSFTDIDGQINTTLTIPLPPVIYTGLQFRAVFTNSLGEDTTSAATLTVNPKTVTPNVTVENKIYDGTTDAIINSRTLTGVVGTDNVSLTGGTASFTDENAGGNKTVTVSGLSLSGSAASNYQLSSTSAAATADITPATLTPVVTVENKTYDGTTAAIIASRSFIGVIEGDDVYLAGGSAEFADRNAGTDKTVTASNVELAGVDSPDYILSTTSPTATADIIPLDITVTAVADSRVYDGTTNSLCDPAVSDELALGDTAAFTQSFDTKNAGTEKLLTPSGSINDGNGGDNYNVTFVPVAGGTITPRQITVAPADVSKTYDGTTDSSGIPNIVSGSLSMGDTANFIQTFDNKNAGTEKTLTPSGSIDDGNSGLNYDITFTSSNIGKITARPITVTASTDSKIYDGGNSSSAIPIITSGTLAAGDSIILTQTFENKTAGTEKIIIPSASIGDGNSGLNYNVTPVNNTGIISPAPVIPQVTIQDKIYNGDTVAVISTRSLNGVIGEDNVILTGGSASFTDANAGLDKPVTVTGLALDGLDSTNYELTSTTASTQADIYKASATVILGSLSRTYDGSPKSVTASTEPLGLAVDLTYNGLTTPPTNAGEYSVVGTIDDINYEGTAADTLVIARASQTITFGSEFFADKVYGDTDFEISATSSSGLTVTFTASGHCEITENTVHITGAGDCTVIAHQSGNDNYLEAEDVSHSFIVSKAIATINISGLTHTYNASPEYATVTTDPPGVNYIVTYSQDGAFITSPENAGSYSVEVVIDDANYTGDSVTDTLVISKATPGISWSNPADITYGTPLSSTQLNAVSQVDGAFEYSPADGTILEPGDGQTLSVTWTPDDTANYNSNAVQVTINVLKATPSAIVTSSLNPALTGKTVTLTATISSTYSNPTGEVTFKDGDVPLATAALISGQATYTTSAFSTGAHSITIVYSGDIYFLPVTSSVLNQKINAPQTSGGSTGSISQTVVLNLSGLSSLSEVELDGYGFARSNYKIQSPEEKVTLSITSGTRLTSSIGSPLSSLSISTLTSFPAPPPGNALLLGYTFGPSGASFSPALTLTLKYNPAALPAGVDEKDLYIAYFDGAQWQMLESTVDTQAKTITAKITHFSQYAILGKVTSPAATATPTSKPTVSPSPTPAVTTTSPAIQTTVPTVTLAPTTTYASEKTQPISLPLIIGLIAAIIVIGLIIAVLMIRKPRQRP